MAAPTQYGFELREVATALIKQQNIHEGKWWAVFEFVLKGGVFGQTNAELLPGGLFQIKGIILAQSDMSTPEQFIVDAAEVNPAPKPSLEWSGAADRPPKTQAGVATEVDNRNAHVGKGGAHGCPG
jgi:hypothetical protein